MPETRTAHQRTHSLLLLQKLLGLRSGASPFTLLLDSTEQSSHPLVKEYIHRAKISKTTTIYISFETLRPPKNITHFLPAHKTALPALQSQISELIVPNTPTLLILDTIHSLLPLCTPSLPLSGFLTSLLPTPQVSLLATFHTSIPIPVSPPSTGPYGPSPLALLSYLATTIITLAPLHHVLAEKRATEKALAPPSFGLEAGVEGVLLGRGANGGAAPGEGGRAVVLRVEYRRKSGRGVAVEGVFTPPSPSIVMAGSDVGGTVGLLDEHPLWRASEVNAEKTSGADEEVMQSTFSLDLTEKQRRDREGVVLPYFDAQKGDGVGGRILYQMGEEDLGDWDEEEDEI